MLKTFYRQSFMRFAFCLLFTAFALSSTAQTLTVTGTVTDSYGEAVSGVTVQVKGTTVGLVTDDAGKYSINIAGENSVLVFSLLGYVSQEIRAGGKTVVNVTLAEAVEQFEELVVVGYGTQKKESLTGAVSVINNEELVTTKTNNIQNSLTGKMAGVKVVQGSSEPGTFDTDFSIRGMGTPLFVIDGVPRENMTRLDPSEVESISILKDASAAIYGTRAANGVVLITTKEGAKGSKFRFEYTGYLAVERFINEVQALNAVEYMSLVNEKNFNFGNTNIPYGRSQFEPYLNGTKQSSDWVNEFINPTPLSTQHSFSVSGGTKKLGYFFNFGYATQNGRWSAMTLKYHRFNLRSNVNAEIAPGLKADVKINLMQESTRRPPRDTWRIFENTWELYPTDPIYLPDPVTGEPSKDYPFRGNTDFHPGLWTSEVPGYEIYYQRLIQTNLGLTYNVPKVPGLTVSGMYSYDFRLDDTKRVVRFVDLYDHYYKHTVTGVAYVHRENVYRTNTMMQFSAKYDKKFGNHSVNAMVLYEESEREADNYWVERVSVLRSVDELFAGSSDNIKGSQIPSNRYDYTNKGLVGRLNYDYNSKYLATFSFRYDGSSKFGPGHQWGFFPVGSVGWRITEEPFIKSVKALKFMNNFKIRASYGVMGDDSAADYQFLAGYNYPYVQQTTAKYPVHRTGSMEFPGGNWVMDGKVVTPLKPKDVANKEITWYTATTLDLGADVEFWRGLLGVTFDVFQRDRSGLLATRVTSLPEQAGMNLPQENINSDRTQGMELTLTHKNKLKNGLKYNISTHFAMDRSMNRYVEMTPLYGQYSNWRNNPTDRWDFWQTVWGVNYLGQFQSIQEVRDNDVVYDEHGNIYMLPGDLRYEDWNGDGVINGYDEHPIGTKHVILSYGITVGAEFKGFDLNFVFQGTALNRRRLGDISPNYEQPLRQDVSGLAVFADRWHRADEFKASVDQDWVAGYYPSMYTGIPIRGNPDGFILRNSEFWMMNATYLRLKTVEIGYSLPSNLVSRIGLTRARIFFNGYNLLTLSSIKLVDAEQSNRYPLNKAFNIGLNISF